MYAYFLAVLVSIQLSVFILLTAMALWVDQLLHGFIGKLSSHTAVYDGTFVITTILLIPWLMMGWYAVRGERRILTWLFLFLALVLLGAWTTMFYSRIYRFTFVDWPFFTITTGTSFASIISSGVFAFACLRNYGKGLGQWLRVEDSFWKSDFEPDVFANSEIEQEWKLDADRASIYKAALPELLRDDGPLAIATV